MAENRKDQQGQGNLKGQNQGQGQQNQGQGGRTGQNTDVNKKDDTEQEGTKLPGRETRTPVAETDRENQDQGQRQGNQGRENDQRQGNQGGNQGRNTEGGQGRQGM